MTIRAGGAADGVGLKTIPKADGGDAPRTIAGNHDQVGACLKNRR